MNLPSLFHATFPMRRVWQCAGRICTAIVLILSPQWYVLAHDTWVQTNTPLIRTGDCVHIDLMLGNHGNEHRDFKLASKVGLESINTLDVIGPKGFRLDIKDQLVDLGLAPKEGFHSAKFTPAKPGFYVVAQTSDRVVNHGKSIRSVRSAKTFFGVTESLDKPALEWTDASKQLGHPLELVPLDNPVGKVGPGIPLKIRLLFQGKPLPNTKISFIPRGTTLKEGLDKDHERITDLDGVVSFVPKEGNYHLMVAHHSTPVAGKDYESTLFAATLTILVPQVCPCCGE